MKNYYDFNEILCQTMHNILGECVQLVYLSVVLAIVVAGLEPRVGDACFILYQIPHFYSLHCSVTFSVNKDFDCFKTVH